MTSLLLDLRHAVRMLLKAPVFTGVTITTLALGIGANSAVFSLVNAVLLRPLGYADVDRLLLLYQASESTNIDKMPVSLPDLIDLRGMQRSLEATAAYRTCTFELSARTPERIHAARIEAGLLPTLGVEPMLGRNFTIEEDTPGNHVAILSYGFWQRRYEGDPRVLGSRLLLDRRPYTIVAVMGPAFQFPRRGPRFNNEPAEVYVPMAFTDFERARRGGIFINGVVARMRRGVTLAQVRSELAVLSPRIRARYGAEFPASLTVQVHAFPLRDEVSARVRRPLLVLLAAVGLVLLVACANVGSLILSRADTRRHEIGIRVALGAGRPRILRMLLVEHFVLAIAGGGAGLLMAVAVVRSLPSVIATSLPGVENVAIDTRVLAFTAALSLLTALFFGVAPYWSARGIDIAPTLRQTAARASRGHAQRTFVVVTVTVSVVVLSGAGLLLRSLGQLLTVDLGFNPDRVLTMTLTVPQEAYNTAEQVLGFYAALTERAADAPDVRFAGVATDLPMRGDDGSRGGFTPERSALPPNTVAAQTWVLGDYFQALGIPLVQGRHFFPEETTRPHDTIVVNEALAARVWPGRNPIGQRLRWGLRRSQEPWLTVVGVVGDVNDGPPGVAPSMHIYEPYSPASRQTLEMDSIDFGRTVHLVVRGSGDPTALLAPLRARLAQLDPALAITRISTMHQRVGDAVAPQRFSTVVLSGFAGGALLLAGIGLYGVLSSAVTQRRREIGVRMALGATPQEVRRLVVRQGMTLVAIGLLLGIGGAFAATRSMAALLFRTSPMDPLTFAIVPIVLLVVGLLACYLPASRASRVEPIVTLRAE